MTAAPIQRTTVSVLPMCLTVLALLACAGCSPSATPLAAPTASSALPSLQGSYCAPTGAILTITGPGTYRSTGGSGTFTVSGNHVDMVREDGKPIRGHRPDADRLVLTAADGGAATVTFYRAGSAAAQTPEALTRPATTRTDPPPPTPDPAVPLDRYTPVDDAETLRELAFAFSEDPFGEKTVASLLPDGPSTDDAFARRERVQRDGAAVVERLKAYGANRYYRIAASTVAVDMPRTAADFNRKPRFVWSIAPGGFRLGPYDFEHKGFPVGCLGNGKISVYPMPVVDFVVRPSQPTQCLLPVSDETVARRIEAKRAAGDGTFSVQAELYWFAVGPKGSVLQANLTHADIKLLSSPALDGSNVLATFSVPL